jgi:hypothetical protein
MAMRSSITHNSKRRRSRPILLIGGDKGGVGKSFGARSIVAWLRRHGYVVVGFDGDARNGHLSRYCGASMRVDRVTLRTALDWSKMFHSWEEVDADCMIVVDLPGNIGDMVEAEELRLQMVAEALGREIANVWVADEEEDSVWLLPTALKVADASRTLFWMNGRFAVDEASFTLWQTSNTRANFIASGGLEALLPVLPIYPRIKIRAARCPFDDVTSAGLTQIERIDFLIWETKLDDSLAPFAQMLENLA